MIKILSHTDPEDVGQTKRISNWWYLHGKLEEDVGYDKALMLDNDQLKSLKYTDKDNSKEYEIYYLPDGIYDVMVDDKPCNGYFWTIFSACKNIDGIVPNMHGLVCYKDDEKSNKYAYRKYNERTEYI